MCNLLLQFWNKILFFAAAIVTVILISVCTDLYVGKILLLDLREQMKISDDVGELVGSLEEESELFIVCVRKNDYSNEDFLLAMERTERAVDSLTINYSTMGDECYVLTHAIKESYGVYAAKRNTFFSLNEERERYLVELYELYDMQNYLVSYGRSLLLETSEAGNMIFQGLIPQVLLLSTFFLALSTLLVIYITELIRAMNKSLIEPVLLMAEASGKIARNDYSGDDIETENEDEIADLVHAFNKMKHATQNYIVALEDKREVLELLHSEEMQKIEMENQLEHAKFEVLKSQMNPHFLFNTLNVISGMANLEDADLTESMIKSLSNMFRYNLRTGETEIALDRELKALEDYLYLQKMRFGERIKWEVHCEESIRGYLVPTFLFQPLAENAIVHGLSPKIEGGRIYITVLLDEEKLHISVRDNGIGMKAEVMEDLRRHLKDKEDIHHGIGVGNIFRRIHLLYDESEFDIESTYGVGTEIRIVIPAREYVD